MAKKNEKKNKTNLERRDLLKGLAGVPVAGFFFLNLWQKVRRDKIKKSNLLSNLIKEKKAPARSTTPADWRSHRSRSRSEPACQ